MYSFQSPLPAGKMDTEDPLFPVGVSPFPQSSSKSNRSLDEQSEKKLNVVRRILKPNIQQSQYCSYGGLISPEGETRATSTHHFEKEKKWNQSIIPLTCRTLNKQIQNINLRLEAEGQPIEQVELVGHVCNVSYGRAFTMKGEQNFMCIEISDLTDICSIIIYQSANDPENLVEYLKRTENWQHSPQVMLTGVYVRVLVKPKYVVTEQKWKNNCVAIKIIQDANEITKHYLDVIKCYLERTDGFIKKSRSPIQDNPIYQRAKEEEAENRKREQQAAEEEEEEAERAAQASIVALAATAAAAQIPAQNNANTTNNIINQNQIAEEPK